MPTGKLSKAQQDKVWPLAQALGEALPQKRLREVLGCQAKTLQDRAEKYGFPWGGPTCNLWALLRWCVDRIAADGRELEAARRKVAQAEQLAAAAGGEELALYAGASSPSLERLRKLKGDEAELDVLEKRGVLVRRAAVAQSMGQAADAIRRAGEKLERRFGPEARELIEEAIGELERMAGE